MKMKEMLSKYWITAVGVIIGAVGGYFFSSGNGGGSGCALSGGCIFSSSPLMSAVLGALLMGLLFNLFSSSKNK